MNSPNQGYRREELQTLFIVYLFLERNNEITHAIHVEQINVPSKGLLDVPPPIAATDKSSMFEPWPKENH
jgi:hypothetical protein